MVQIMVNGLTKCVNCFNRFEKKDIALGLCKLIRFHILCKKTYCFLEKITQLKQGSKIEEQYFVLYCGKAMKIIEKVGVDGV